MAKKEKTLEKKPGVFKKIGKFFSDCRSERKKVIWPTLKTTFKNTGVVLSAIIISSLFIGALDFGLTKLLGVIMNIAN